MATLHPTAHKLVRATSELLEKHEPNSISVQQVIETSGVSSGSLYHHFHSLGNLVNHALADQFREYGDSIVKFTTRILHTPPGPNEALGLHSVSGKTAARIGTLRKRATRVIAYSIQDRALEELLRPIQDRITQSIAGVFEELKRRGYLQPQVDPLVAAVFIQAYVLGRIVDDLAITQINNDDWLALISHVNRAAIFVPGLNENP